MKDGAPFVFAGLWEGWKDPANNEWLHTCTIITGEPNEFAAADPHPDADNSAGRASRCLVNREAGKEISVPFPAERMKAWPVSRRVNKPRNDDADIVSRIGVTITLKDLDM